MFRHALTYLSPDAAEPGHVGLVSTAGAAAEVAPQLAVEVRLGFGRIVASETEIPVMLANLV